MFRHQATPFTIGKSTTYWSGCRSSQPATYREEDAEFGMDLRNLIYIYYIGLGPTVICTTELDCIYGSMHHFIDSATEPKNELEG